MAGFDKIQITRDSKANIVANLDKLNEFEPILATDEKKLYTKLFGVLTDLTGLGTSDIVNDFNGGDGVASANIVKVLKGLVDVNTASLTNKLEKGSYTGDAQDLKNEINANIQSGEGWVKYSGGTIVQWGVATGTKEIIFPISFTSKPLVMSEGTIMDADSIYHTTSGIPEVSVSVNKFYLITYGYIAIGYKGAPWTSCTFLGHEGTASFAGGTKWIAIGK